MRVHNGLSTYGTGYCPRRLTERVLEVEGPISAGVASCLLVNAEPVFRRLRDDLFKAKILKVGMTQGSGFEMQKRSVKVLLDQRGTSRRNKGNREPSKAAGNRRWQAAGNSGKSCDGKRQETLDGWRSKRNTSENSTQRKQFCKLTTEHINLNIYIVGAGA